MFRKYLLILLLVHSVLSDECVRYYFEDYNDMFTTDVPSCEDLATWNHGIYDHDDSPIDAPNEKSESFITPSNTQISCTGSFTFTMMPSALVEVLVYIKRGTDTSLIITLLQRQNTIHPTVGTATLGNDIEDGWHIIEIRSELNIDEPFESYIVFLGFASEDSVIIVDSFRYVPLTMDPEEECILYKDIPEVSTTITTVITTVSTTDPTTIETIAPTTIQSTNTETSIEETTPSTPTDNVSSFWTPLTITITVLVCILILIIVAGVSYYIGGLVARKKIKVDDDIDYEVPHILPRVTRAYPEVNSNKYNS